MLLSDMCATTQRADILTLVSFLTVAIKFNAIQFYLYHVTAATLRGYSGLPVCVTSFLLPN